MWRKPQVRLGSVELPSAPRTATETVSISETAITTWKSGASAPRKASNWGFSPRASYRAGILFALTAFPLAIHAQNPANPNAELPPGPMQSKASTTCTECHEARIILQQRLSKGAWTKEVDKMAKWGAVVDPADRDALIDYLSANFSPDKPAYEAQKTAGQQTKGKSGK
jgi:hypothetical protein